MTDELPREVSLRPTAEQDVSFVVAVESAPECRGLVGQWTPEEHLSCLVNPDRAHLIAEADGHRVGFVILYDLTRDRCGAYLKRIVVTVKGQGLGRRVLALVADHALERWHSRYLWLGVVPHNARAIRCYRAAGFTPFELPLLEAERHRRIADGPILDDCLIYRLDLRTPAG